MEREKIRSTPFSESRLKFFKELLLAKREKAIKELDLLDESMASPNETEDEHNVSTGRQIDDLGADAEERQLNFQLQERTRKYISQIDAALERIENGTYGICLATGKPISEERLKIVPHTRYSIEAKEKGLADGN